MSHDSLLALALLFAAAVCLFAQVSHGNHVLQKRHDTERAASEDEDDGDAQPEGQSRAWGGQNQTVEGDAFPWFHIMFRDPKARLNDEARLQDGYTTGYAIRVAHHVFLGHKNVIRRASKMHGKVRVMQGMRHLGIHDRWVDPYNDVVWEEPKGGLGMYQGVVRKLADLGRHFALYHIRREPYPFKERAAAARPRRKLVARPAAASRLDSDGEPPFDYPAGKGAYAYKYPRLNKDKNLTSNCYMYAMASADSPDGVYRERAIRTFVRIPVKIVEQYCDENNECLSVVHDKSRAQNHKRGMTCETFQDVGAPIMCSDKEGGRAGGDPQSDFYQRRYLKLSYVLRWPYELGRRPFTASCRDGAYVMRVAEYADKIEQEIDKLSKTTGL